MSISLRIAWRWPNPRRQKGKKQAVDSHAGEIVTEVGSQTIRSGGGIDHEVPNARAPYEQPRSEEGTGTRVRALAVGEPVIDQVSRIAVEQTGPQPRLRPEVQPKQTPEKDVVQVHHVSRTRSVC